MISKVNVFLPSVRVTWLLRELDIEFTMKDPKELQLPGGVLAPENLKYNAQKSVPLIELEFSNDLEKCYMYENAAVLRFVATNAKEFPHLPPSKTLRMRHQRISVQALEPPVELIPTQDNCKDLKEILIFEQWFAFSAGQLQDVLQQLQVLYHFRKNQPQEKSLLDMYAQKWNKELLPQLEKRFNSEIVVKENEYFLRNFGFSILDILLGHLLHWSQKFDFLSEFSVELKSYFKRLCQREGFVASIQDRITLNPRFSF